MLLNIPRLETYSHIQELLGHSRISRTFDLYSQGIPLLQEKVMQRFFSYLTSQ